MLALTLHIVYIIHGDLKSASMFDGSGSRGPALMHQLIQRQYIF